MFKKAKLYKGKKIINSKGNIFKILDIKSKGYDKFGEVYLSFVKKNTNKGWKYHKKMKMNLVAPIGEIEIILFDDIKKKFYKYLLSDKNFNRLVVYPKTWFSFKGLRKINALVNVSNIKHDKKEVITKNKLF
tara:strand:- start:212 stop:607 length:396 start_codon:yes stop_codon:yes gene_type:complete